MSSATASAAAGNRGDQRLGTSVYVYNYAQVPSGTLITAQKRATSIFREVGLEIRWCNVTVESTPSEPDSSCDQPAGLAKLELRILPRFKTVAGETNDSTMGYAVGSLATISYDWVEHAVPSGIAMPTEILACAISHEIGHILLGPNSHSRTGIMMARWSPEELRGAGWGRLLFTTEQAQRLRAATLARTESGARRLAAALSR